MAYEIVFLDQVDLTETSLRELEGAGQVRVAPVDRQEDLAEAIRGADALLYQMSPLLLSGTVLKGCHGLKVIGRIGIGMDQVDLGAAAECGITVVNAARAQAAAVADHAMTLILCLARNVIDAHTSVLTEGQTSPRRFMGRELSGKNLGLIGFGAAGRAVAVRAFAFGMSVHAHDPYLSPQEIEQAGAIPRDLAGLLADSDFISIHAPLTDETRHLIGAAELRTMRTGAYLINTARGPIIDEEALAAALREGVIAGAGLDVFEDEPLPSDSPLIGLDRVILTPHIAGWTIEAQARTQETVARDVARVLRGEAPHSPVPLPEKASDFGRRSPPGSRPEPPPLQPYAEWSESGLPHPSDTHPFGTVPGLRSIIEVEGPLTTARAYKLYVRGAGSTRVTKLVQEGLDMAVNRLLEQDEIQIDDLDNPTEDSIQRVVRRRGDPAVVVRRIGNRGLYEAPLNEIAHLMKQRMDRHPNATHESLMRYVLNTYGWRRLTDKARTYLTSAIDLMYQIPDNTPRENNHREDNPRPGGGNTPPPPQNRDDLPEYHPWLGDQYLL